MPDLDMLLDLDRYTTMVFVLVAVLAIVFVTLLRRQRALDGGETQLRERLQAHQQAELAFAGATEAAMNDLKSSVEGLATCLANLELRMRTVDQRQRKFDDMAVQFSRRRGFDEAVQLVRDGIPPTDVARRCGVPLAEAELLQRIHQQGMAH